MKYIKLTAIVIILFTSCEKQDPKPETKKGLMVAPEFHNGTDNNKLRQDSR